MVSVRNPVHGEVRYPLPEPVMLALGSWNRRFHKRLKWLQLSTELSAERGKETNTHIYLFLDLAAPPHPPNIVCFL